MAKIKIGHTSDWHLCATQYGKKFRADAIYNACLEGIKAFFDNDVRYIVNSGDILDASRNGSYPVSLLDRLHEELVKRSMTMFTLTGNHDWDEPPWIEKYNHPDGVGIVSVDNKRINIRGTKLHIVGYKTKTPNELFERLKENPGEPTDIALWHGGVIEFTGGGKYPAAQEFFDRSYTRNWMLGDIHVCSYITTEDSVIGYPGPVEMTDVDEDPSKYIVVHEFNVETGKFEGFKQHKIPTTPVVIVKVAAPEDVEPAEKLLHSTGGVPRFVWFHYTNEYEDVVNALHIHTGPFDIVRKKNITPRTAKAVHEVMTGDVVSVSIIDVAQELMEGEDDDLQALAFNIVKKDNSPHAVLEQYITKHENSFA
jgi:DNA repair exonuclease SbcCD nuclease subunit